MLLLPLPVAGASRGILAISCKQGPLSSEEHWFAKLLGGQLTQALRIENLRMERQQAQVTAETEKARSKFLRAISHDLRTPLTGIIGAGSLLLESGDRLDEAVQSRLAKDIQEDAAWLLNMVQNILFTTRIQAEGVVITQTEEVVEEVIADAVAGIRKRFPDCHIEVSAPQTLVMAPMDAMLISQVVSNLLENALRHAGKTNPHVEITLQAQDGHACVTVADDGQGVPEDVLPTLFEQQPFSAAFTRSDDASRGFGIGLSLSRAIVEAHHGTIEGGNGPQGGALFRFCLPMKREML